MSRSTQCIHFNPERTSNVTDQPRTRGKIMSGLLTGPLVILALVAVLLTLPVSVPLALLWGRWERWRLRTVTGRTRCVQCGCILGRAALHAADAAHIAELEALHRQHPHCLVNVRRRSDARCKECDATYTWERGRYLLQPLAVATSPEQ